MFDWQRFLSGRGVPFVTSGPNTKRGNISVRCPWCGDADPSQHMGISLRGEGWGCLRNRTHRGRSRAKLIAALLHCSLEEAHRLAGTDAPSPTALDPDFGAEIAALLGVEVEKKEKPAPVLLPEFKPMRHYTGLRSYTGLVATAWDYLADRGFLMREAEWLARHYDLHFASLGDFRYRIVIPIYSDRGELLTWTARTVVPDEPQRYKTLLTKKSKQPITSTLLDLQNLVNVVGGRALVICEGPFDGIRISTFGHDQGIWGTCLFGLNISDSQVLLLERLSRQFEQLVLLLDPDASMETMRIQEALLPLHVRVAQIPEGVKDPGALSRNQFDTWARWLLAGQKKGGMKWNAYA